MKNKHDPTLDSIVVTLAAKTIKERKGGLKQILSEWKQSDGEKLTWWYKLGNAPKNPVIWVYWVLGGRIRCRSRLAGIVKTREMQFSDQSKPLYGKVWLVLFNFEPIPRAQQIDMQGFQGFRYFNSTDHEIKRHFKPMLEG